MAFNWGKFQVNPQNIYLWCEFKNHWFRIAAATLRDNVIGGIPLRWDHNERDCVSNHQPHGCLLNHSFRPRSKKISKLRVTGLCHGEFPAQRASNAENVPIWWRHHVHDTDHMYHDILVTRHKSQVSQHGLSWSSPYSHRKICNHHGQLSRSTPNPCRGVNVCWIVYNIEIRWFKYPSSQDCALPFQ